MGYSCQVIFPRIRVGSFLGFYHISCPNWILKHWTLWRTKVTLLWELMFVFFSLTVASKMVFQLPHNSEEQWAGTKVENVICIFLYLVSRTCTSIVFICSIHHKKNIISPSSYMYINLCLAVPQNSNIHWGDSRRWECSGRGWTTTREIILGEICG